MIATIENRATDSPSRWINAISLGIVAITTVLLIAMPIVKFLNLHSNFYDLGQYATFLYGIAFDSSWGDLFSTHAHPIAAPYALIYRLAPSNLTLLLLQSGVVVLSGLLFGAYWRRLALPQPMLGLLLYLLSFSTWFAALFEFHFEHLIFPIVFGFFLVVETPDRARTRLLAVLLGLLLCLVKEVYPLTACMLGVYLLIGKRWYLAGLALIVLPLGYFLLATKVAIPAFSHNAQTGEIWNSAFGYLGNTPPQMLRSLILDPLIPLRELLAAPRKLVFVVGLFGSLAFLSLLRPILLLPSLPALGISVLSHNPNHYYLGHQYTVVIVAVLLVTTAKALTAWSRPAQGRWIAAMLVTTVATQIAFGPSPMSRLFWSPNVFSYNWRAYVPNEHDRTLARVVDQFIPEDDRLIVSTQNAINSDRISNRRLAFAFPWGTFGATDSVAREELTASSRSADYVVLDRTRPLSLQDDICLYDRMTVCDSQSFLSRFDERIRRMKQNFEVLYERDGILIARRFGRIGASIK